MAATNQKILGQIIRLARSITFQEPVGEEGFKLQFIARIPTLDLPGVGPSVTLWKSKGSFRAVENIARLIRSSHPEAADCDTDTIEDLVTRTIQDLILDQSIFDIELIISAGQNYLADCRADADITQFSGKIYDHLMARVRVSIHQWCTALGVPRVMCESFDIPQIGLSLISRMDAGKWEEIVSSCYKTNNWSHLLGCTPDSGGPQLFGLECTSLVVHQSNGTQKGSKFSSRLEFAKFFAVLYATVTVQEDLRLYPAMAAPYTWCIQFPSRNSSGLQVTQSQLEEAVFPFFCADLKLSNGAVKSIQKWYVGLSSLPPEQRARVEKACHFVNRGIMTRGLDSYVNFFISLDALFGAQGDVGGSIQRGVESMSIDIALKERVSWLYELRSELVHGGSRFCAEWKDYDRYYAHFRTKPEEDVNRIACSALLCSTKSAELSDYDVHGM
jgi:hypothetical protein